MSINYNKLFNPNSISIKENISDIYNIIGLEEVLLAISEKLINYREKYNLTQAQLAEKLHCNQSMISKLEKGDYNPTFKQIYDISIKLTNSPMFFTEILKNIEDKINKISKGGYKFEVDSECINNGYYVCKTNNSKVVNMRYKGIVGGNVKYEECTSSLTNAG